ncbi:uncharacterized protein TRIADDRAFT_51362 [Trichoplax adhaerens]|uniref:Mucin-like protein n=1 Tax=Trichoplax adhaerens TaxID=10228 RepID=B3RIT7_TRIAD|nr:hypothetical protein TRIADDRAFT_51362 [Trichoplax adhaerens]EDV29249.1 hypothetical protein TRIADDRAFT_51362 [Trichoplax adhaerens]|eukprot:XP_002108451.1 hypothetical protein TRIADDRAFT_51362 [Trichoplax adhaerens]
MDGKQYTFNGLGEYQLLNLQNNYVDVQARTSQALINGTRSAKATVFSAFAAKQNNSDVIQATLNDQNNGLDILVNGNIPLTLNDLSQNETREYNNVDLALSQNGSLVVAFSSGTSLEVTVLPGLISIAVNAPASLQGNSKGLLGVWNGNMNDDFTRPDGSKILINATEFEIYYDFGEKWKINETQSLFTYPPGTTYQNFTDPDFLPLFSDNITALFGGDNDLYQQALSSCGNNIPCLYDASQTLNVELAVQGKDTADGYQEAENQAENFPPVITGPTTLNVTFGEVYTTALSVSDPNTGDTVTVTADSVPPGASFNPTSYQFTWNVSTYTNISIQIVAKDSKNAASIYSPAQIIMCYCANGGTCDYTGETIEDGSVSQVPCICSDGWTGDHCTFDFDSCANFPCYENVTCTDNVAPLTGYTCGSCPQGYTGDGILCSDFDECASSATNSCQQVCVNTIGGYTCDCQSGYQLNADGKTCLDADECFKNSQICGQICTNTNGSYICSCHSGFNLNSDNKSCIAATTCSSNNNCSESCTLINGKDQCACKNGYILQPDGVSCKDRDECADKIDTCQMLCNNTIGGYQCSCSSGYSLNVDGKTCSDINECSTFNACHSNANCQNTPGSYTCSCNSGYTGNGKTCTAPKIAYEDHDRQELLNLMLSLFHSSIALVNMSENNS